MNPTVGMVCNVLCKCNSVCGGCGVLYQRNSDHDVYGVLYDLTNGYDVYELISGACGVWIYKPLLQQACFNVTMYSTTCIASCSIHDEMYCRKPSANAVWPWM